MENNLMSGNLSFFFYLGQAKRTFRSGWVLRGIKEPESIADHMYRMTMMCYLAPNNLDRIKCMEMCLIHDLSESIVGDLTPQDNINKEEKLKLEKSAFETLIGLIDKNKSHLQDLFNEYSLHVSPEAKFVKSLDLFDMYLQAYEYELLNNVDLSEFYNNMQKFEFEENVKKWIDELMILRSEKNHKHLPKDSNLNTILKYYLRKH